MSVKTFADSNVMIYAFSSSDIKKRDKVQRIFDDCHLVISTQVLREFINVMTRKLGVSLENIKQQIDHIISISTVVGEDLESIHEGIEVHQIYKFGFYDSLIVSAALRTGCTVLLSEDMHHGQVINGVLTIINPFA